MRLFARLLRLACAAAAVAGCVGCAMLPPEGPRSYSTAIAPQAWATPLDRVSQASMAGASPTESGFRLVLGPSGLDVRLALLRRAQRSLDLQYYHLHDDATGRLVLRELRDAAMRGVRVRLLLDDLYTDGLEPLLNGLGAYRNIEVRLFNPFPTRGSVGVRFAAALVDFGRLNRRMHNKLFVADGVLAVTGGRNLGDEYFMRSAHANFFDYDMLAAGSVVPQMSSLFDEYWNAAQVRTAASVLQPLASPEELRQAFSARVEGEHTPSPAPFRGLDRLGRTPVVDELDAGRIRLAYGQAQAFADSPAKAWGELQTARLPSGALLDNARLLLTQEFRTAHRAVWLTTPYFVPGPATLNGTSANLQRGVRITLLTNSLAATDEPVVHTGYRRYRDNLLRAGVEIFELHPVLGQRLLLPGEVAAATLRLHTKSAVIDGQLMFIGSVNFDPRSDVLNTEFGVFIRSTELAAQAIALFEVLKREASYQVRLKPGATHDLEWVRTDERGAVEVLDVEPGSDIWTRLKLYIQSLLIPESLL